MGNKEVWGCNWNMTDWETMGNKEGREDEVVIGQDLGKWSWNSPVVVSGKALNKQMWRAELLTTEERKESNQTAIAQGHADRCVMIYVASLLLLTIEQRQQ